jgi:hypothetical protein
MGFILEDKMAGKFNANEARKLSLKNNNKIVYLIAEIKNAAKKGLQFVNVECISSDQKFLLEELGFVVSYPPLSKDLCYIGHYTIEW